MDNIGGRLNAGGFGFNIPNSNTGIGESSNRVSGSQNDSSSLSSRIGGGGMMGGGENLFPSVLNQPQENSAPPNALSGGLMGFDSILGGAGRGMLNSSPPRTQSPPKPDLSSSRFNLSRVNDQPQLTSQKSQQPMQPNLSQQGLFGGRMPNSNSPVNPVNTSFNMPSQSGQNMQSSLSASGFGHPLSAQMSSNMGGQNSQMMQMSQMRGQQQRQQHSMGGGQRGHQFQRRGMPQQSPGMNRGGPSRGGGMVQNRNQQFQRNQRPPMNQMNMGGYNKMYQEPETPVGPKTFEQHGKIDSVRVRRLLEMKRQGERKVGEAFFSNDTFKTEMCSNYMKDGRCPYGPKCLYAHGQHELRKRTFGKKYKTKMCKNYHRVPPIGHCPYGSRCRFIHDITEMQTEGQQQQSQVDGFDLQNIREANFEDPLKQNLQLPSLQQGPNSPQRGESPFGRGGRDRHSPNSVQLSSEEIERKIKSLFDGYPAEDYIRLISLLDGKEMQDVVNIMNPKKVEDEKTKAENLSKNMIQDLTRKVIPGGPQGQMMTNQQPTSQMGQSPMISQPTTSGPDLPPIGSGEGVRTTGLVTGVGGGFQIADGVIKNSFGANVPGESVFAGLAGQKKTLEKPAEESKEIISSLENVFTHASPPQPTQPTDQQQSEASTTVAQPVSNATTSATPTPGNPTNPQQQQQVGIISSGQPQQQGQLQTQQPQQPQQPQQAQQASLQPQIPKIESPLERTTMGTSFENPVKQDFHGQFQQRKQQYVQQQQQQQQNQQMNQQYGHQHRGGRRDYGGGGGGYRRHHYNRRRGRRHHRNYNRGYHDRRYNDYNDRYNDGYYRGGGGYYRDDRRFHDGGYGGGGYGHHEGQYGHQQQKQGQQGQQGQQQQSPQDPTQPKVYTTPSYNTKPSYNKSFYGGSNLPKLSPLGTGNALGPKNFGSEGGPRRFFTNSPYDSPTSPTLTSPSASPAAIEDPTPQQSFGTVKKEEEEVKVTPVTNEDEGDEGSVPVQYEAVNVQQPKEAETDIHLLSLSTTTPLIQEEPKMEENTGIGSIITETPENDTN